MSSSNPSNNDFNGDSNIELNESHSLLFKLYANLLMNTTVQNGLRQLTRLSQPLVGKFDDNLIKITSNVSRWVSYDNVYSHLSNIWLSLAYPFNGNVPSFEALSKEFQSMLKNGKRLENEDALKHFFDFASSVWSSLNEPSNHDIKNALLMVVAKAIDKSTHLKEEILATSLYNTLKSLVEKRRELVSRESFLELVKFSLGEEFYQINPQIIKEACTKFYVFAKRFLLIDFPLATNNKDVIKLILNFVQDNGFYYGDYTLNFIEKYLDFALRVFGQKKIESIGDNNLVEKAHRILGKVWTLSLLPLRKAEDVFHQVQETKAYITADNYLDITNKIDVSIFLATQGFNLLKENLLEPSIDTIKVLRDKVKDQVTVVLHGLDIKLLKKKYNKLYAQYEVLQKCAVIVADKSVKVILDKQAMSELGETGKKEIHRLYHELKAMETQKIRDISLEYYSTILKKANETYNHASRAVYYQKRAIGDQDAATAVRPSNDKEVDAFDNNFHPHNVAGRKALETLALACH